jgi:signal recognition particle receptor subunit beta
MIVDVAKNVIGLKVVYYGPSMSGKTTNLETFSVLNGLKLMKIDTKGDRTLVFDFSTKTVQVGEYDRKLCPLHHTWSGSV